MANLGVVGAPVQPKEPTLSQRLHNAAMQLETHCDRLESTLSRVNGVPQTGVKDAAGIAGQPPLGEVVNRIESLSQRLSFLTDGVERIA